MSHYKPLEITEQNEIQINDQSLLLHMTLQNYMSFLHANRHVTHVRKVSIAEPVSEWMNISQGSKTATV